MALFGPASRLALALAFSCSASMFPCTAFAQTRTVDEYLADVAAVGEPPFDAKKKQEPGYIENYKRAQHDLCRKKAKLLLEACSLHPADARVPELMDRRWVLLGWNQDPAAVADEVLADIEAVMPQVKDPRVVQHAAYWRAWFGAHRRRGDTRAMQACIEPFVDGYPKDERGAGLIVLVAGEESGEDAQRIALWRRLVELHPTAYMAKYAPGMIRRIEERGKPFELAFDDVVTGKPVSVAALHGKVIVIDFWATTCGPCVAEMPQMKAIYEAHRARGVEFVGVSLDEPEEPSGGRTALVELVKKRAIPWPQYYQGGGYDSAFSKSWGVGGIPAVFVVDKQGRLRSTNARGGLEELLKKLLAE